MHKKQPNLFFKYGNLAMQMAVIIGLSVWAGQKLDERYQNKTPVFTIVLSLIGICAALFVVLRDLVKQNNDPKKDGDK